MGAQQSVEVDAQAKRKPWDRSLLRGTLCEVKYPSDDVRQRMKVVLTLNDNREHTATFDVNVETRIIYDGTSAPYHPGGGTYHNNLTGSWRRVGDAEFVAGALTLVFLPRTRSPTWAHC